MQPSAVAAPFYVVRNCAPGLVDRVKDAMRVLGHWIGEGAFESGLVVADAGGAYAWMDLLDGQQLLVAMIQILAATAAMLDEPIQDASPQQGRIQRILGGATLWPLLLRPIHNPARAEILDKCELAPANKCAICQLIDLCDYKLLNSQ